jgi:hypothetical protein
LEERKDVLPNSKTGFAGWLEKSERVPLTPLARVSELDVAVLLQARVVPANRSARGLDHNDTQLSGFLWQPARLDFMTSCLL